jgi:hypothetical protein
MDSAEKELNVDTIGYQCKDEDNDKKFRIKGTLINDTIQTYVLITNYRIHSLPGATDIQLDKSVL